MTTSSQSLNEAVLVGMSLKKIAFSFSLFFQPVELSKRPAKYALQFLEALSFKQEHQFSEFNQRHVAHATCFRQSVFAGEPSKLKTDAFL